MLSLLIGCALLPSGTTSNEALHYETNRCFKETQKLHLTSLQQKLDILQLGKLLSHNRAFCHHTTKQVQHGEVLSRATRQSIWYSSNWSTWCAELLDGPGPKAKRISAAGQPDVGRAHGPVVEVAMACQQDFSKLKLSLR